MRYLFILFAFAALTACQQQEQESLLQEKEGSTHMQYVSNSDPVKREKKNTQQIARHLAKLAVEVPDVKDATALVVGNYAVVGIDVDKDLDRSEVGVIKFSTAEALKDDPYGKEAMIIADADGVERIRELGDKMAEGHPVEAITNELSQIVSRYLPEGPIQQTPSDKEEKSESVPEKEQDKLNNIQKEQSSDQ
ncbi:YhcN/YlaJ family sporulation lipoprotein [Halobacillus sp. Marseille-Q1614]|uniref:YhcN/YlaJ family sporulation lipoprotein n=1 Tax=Halobacillus sp. Marseille-Q1614 TaxID=2709134 RepID=UPI00156E8240|nr:YhcN/YlaJ family sporulation lipoprotein [Halobacillus sp. Marseille-Q1614]